MSELSAQQRKQVVDIMTEIIELPRMGRFDSHRAAELIIGALWIDGFNVEKMND